MPCKFVNTIVFVKNIDNSKKFYTGVLGLKIVNDFKTIVFFENHLVLHCTKSILNTVFKQGEADVVDVQRSKNLLIYFECDSLVELEKLYANLKNEVNLIHDIEIQSWGQSVFRFYDPDGHIVEFGAARSDS